MKNLQLSNYIIVLFVSSVLSILIIMSAAIEVKDHEDMGEFHDSETILSCKIYQFAEKLHQAMSNDLEKNIIFSPISIHSALSMMSLGVKSDSQSEKDLNLLLGYDKDNNTVQNHIAYRNIMKQFKLVTEESEQVVKNHEADASSDHWAAHDLSSRPPVIDMWTMGVIDKTKLNVKFSETIKEKYYTSIKQVGNKSEANALANEVNEWAKKTGFEGNVVDSSDLLVGPENIGLFSAIRIQGWWGHSFYEHELENIFYNLGLRDKLVKKGVALITSDVYGKFALFSNDASHDQYKRPKQLDEELNKLEFRMAEIDLIGNLTFTIIEPLRNGTGRELNDLESQLLKPTSSESSKKSLLARSLELMSKRSEQFERVQFPKFKYENDIDLKRLLSSIGLRNLFTDSADLTEISDSPMKIKEARHQAVIEVDKNGLKGGALTRLHIAKLSLVVHRNPINIIVKHPFLFLIRYNSIVLLMGKVVQV